MVRLKQSKDKKYWTRTLSVAKIRLLKTKYSLDLKKNVYINMYVLYVCTLYVCTYIKPAQWSIYFLLFCLLLWMNEMSLKTRPWSIIKYSISKNKYFFGKSDECAGDECAWMMKEPMMNPPWWMRRWWIRRWWSVREPSAGFKECNFHSGFLPLLEVGSQSLY